MDSSLALARSDNPVARKLLKAQLERVKLQVETTTNGEEAIAAREKYGPGHFQAAMFDHRTFDGPPTCLFFVQGSFDLSDMPVCDGVQAARRIRVLEAERGYDPILPSKHVTDVHPHVLYSPSYRTERGLSRVHEAAVFEFWNGRPPLEACE